MSSHMLSLRCPRRATGDSGRGRQVSVNRELLIAGALFVALVIVGTAFSSPWPPTIADLGALYGPTT